MKKNVLIALSAILLGTSCASTGIVGNVVSDNTGFYTSHNSVHEGVNLSEFKHMVIESPKSGKNAIMDKLNMNIRSVLKSHFEEMSVDTVQSAMKHGFQVVSPFVSMSTEIGEGGKSTVVIMLYDYKTDNYLATITAVSQEEEIAEEHKRVLQLLNDELTKICK